MNWYEKKLQDEMDKSDENQDITGFMVRSLLGSNIFDPVKAEISSRAIRQTFLVNGLTLLGVESIDGNTGMRCRWSSGHSTEETSRHVADVVEILEQNPFVSKVYGRDDFEVKRSEVVFYMKPAWTDRHFPGWKLV